MGMPARDVDADVAAAWAPLALDEHRFALARELALRMLDDPDTRFDGWRIYLRVAQETGLLPVALAELRASPDPTAPLALAWWEALEGAGGGGALRAGPDPAQQVALAWVLLARGEPGVALELSLPPSASAGEARLRALAQRGDARALHREAKAWVTEHPDQPGALVALWEPGAPPVRARKAAIQALARGAQAPDVDLDWVLQALQVARAARDPLGEPLAARVPEITVGGRALPPPLPRGRWGSPMQQAMGNALAGLPAVELPPATPTELVGMAGALGESWLAAGRAHDVVRLWDEVAARIDGPSWRVELGRGVALKAAGEEEAAREALREALRLTTAPWDDDPCGLDLQARATAADQVIAVAGGGARPSALTAALRGDLSLWLAEAEDPFQRACLHLGSSGIGGWGGRHGPAAAQVLPRLYAEAAHAEGPPGPAPRRAPEVGDPFPRLALPLARGAVTSADFEGQPLLLTLWASWCGPCRQELPELDGWLARMARAGVPVRGVALSVDEDPRAYERALQRMGLQHMEAGRRAEAARELATDTLPVSWLIGPDGKVWARHLGYDVALAARLEAQLLEGGHP